MMQSYPLKFTDTFERDDPDCHRRSNVCSDFKTGRSCVIGGMTLHCGLPAGKLKLAVILVQRSSMRVTKGTSRMRGGYQATFPLLRGLGTRLRAMRPCISRTRPTHTTGNAITIIIRSPVTHIVYLSFKYTLLPRQHIRMLLVSLFCSGVA